MKIIKIIVRWIFIICIPVFLISAGIGIVANGLSLWPGEWGSERYKIRETLSADGLNFEPAQLKEVYAELVRYFISTDEYIDIKVIQDGQTIKLFNEEETTHFKEVQGLLRLDYGLCLGSLVYILAFAGICLFRLKDRHGLALELMWGAGLTIALLLALVLLDTLYGFNELWYRFHLLFFRYPFSSPNGYMLSLFPEQFFSDAAVFCVCFTLTGALILGGVGWRLLKKSSL